MAAVQDSEVVMCCVDEKEENNSDLAEAETKSGSSSDLSLESRKGFFGGTSHVLAAICGPGMLACLADTDSGCLTVAAQSGSQWGYAFLWLQVILIPVLFIAQELTVRLGIHTGKGHTALIRQHFGLFWAWFSVVPLVIQCTATMVSEMAGVAAVGELWGLSRFWATLVAAAAVVIVVLCFRYRQIEIIGVTFGLFELSFVVSMFIYHPDPKEVFKGSVELSANSEFSSLIAANVGAVIMPWMIYFQQSAVVARGLTLEDLPSERASTLVGSALTQLVMIGTMVTAAAASSARKNVDTVEDIAVAMEPALGLWGAKVCVSLAFVGGSICAAFVVSLAASWSIVEAIGVNDRDAISLNVPLKQAKVFYSCFLLVVAGGVLLLLLGIDLVNLMLAVVVVDACLVPFTVGFLFLLATGSALPEEARISGCRRILLALMFTVISVVCIGSTIYGFVAPSKPDAN